MDAPKIEGPTRKFRVSMTVEIAAADMTRIRGELLERHPEARILDEDHIDSANVNGVVCGALGRLAEHGGFQIPDLCDRAAGTIVGYTNADAKVRVDYSVTEEACAHC